MGIRLLFAGVIGVVGRDAFHIVLLAQTQQHFIDHALLLEAVTVDFRVKVLAQRLLPPDERLLRLLLTNVQDERWNLPKQPACGDDDVFLELLDQGFVDARYVVESVGVGLGAELGQFVVAVLVFGEKNGRVAVVLGTAIGVVTADVKFGANDGFDARFVGRPDELKRPHHVAVVRNGQCIHAVAHRRVHEFAHVAHCLQNAELAMRVQVDERNVVAEGFGCSRCGLRWGGLGRCGFEVRSLKLRRLVHDGIRILNLGTLDDAQAA